MTQNSLDRRVTAVCAKDHLVLTLANVTDTARALERNHLCGPVAGLIQAEFTAAAALLGTLTDHDGQTVLLRVNFPDGQLRGAVIEVTHEGTVRGYVRRKVLPELDDADISDKELFRKAIGCKAQCAVIVSDRSGADTHAVFGCGFEDHLSVTDILEEYFNNSLQRRAYAQISAASEDGHVACAHALLCEFMPEADQSACGDVEKRFDDGSVQAAMDRGADIAEIAALLGVTPTGFEEKPIRFACTCSDEKVIAMLRTLPKEDREALIAKGEPTDIYCHMCGRGFTITPEQLKAL